jgi:histidine triad (HIT) family protein
MILGDDKMNCVFCKIINGEIPAYTIYEDDIIKVFLDINPDADGHTLIIPKKHFQDISDIDEKVLHHISDISKKIYQLLKEKLNFDGLSIIQNNEFGQEIKHYHLHLLPRYKGNNNHNAVQEVFSIITN